MANIRRRLKQCLLCIILLSSLLVIYDYQRIDGRQSSIPRNIPTYVATTNETLPNKEHLNSNPNRTTLQAHTPRSRPDFRFGKLPIFILSAIVLNRSSHATSQHEVKLTGWIECKRLVSTIKCCTMLNNGDILSYSTSYIDIGNTAVAPFTVTQISCPLNTPVSNVKGVTLQLSDDDCPNDDQNYIKPFVPEPLPKKDSFGVCLKLLYGQDIDSVNFKTWIEYYKMLGVDKVYTFTYNISKTTTDILDEYKEFIDRRPYDYPLKFTHKVGDVKTIYFVSEHVVVFDCYRRFTGYKYLAIVDMDEFIVPHKHNTLKSMMKHLTHAFPNAAGFQLTSFIFLKNYTELAATSNRLPDIEKYVHRTVTLQQSGVRGRLKNIILHDRIHPLHYQTHVFNPLPGFKRIPLGPAGVQLNHYRYCYTNLKEICYVNITKDTSIFKYARRVHNRITNKWP